MKNEVTQHTGAAVEYKFHNNDDAIQGQHEQQ